MITSFALESAGRRIDMRFDLDPEDASCRALQYYFEHQQAPEPEVVHLLFHALREGDVIVDGGANIGFFSVLMSKLVGPTGRVLAVEPDSHNVALLRRNLGLNRCDNVQVIEKALGSEPGEALLGTMPDHGLTSLFYDEKEIERPVLVEVTTLDKLLGGGTARLIKLDIEGGELAALSACPIAATEMVVMEMNPECMARALVSVADVLDCAWAFHFSPFLLHSDGSLPSLVPKNTRVVPERPNGNILLSTMSTVSSMWSEVRL